METKNDIEGCQPSPGATLTFTKIVEVVLRYGERDKSKGRRTCCTIQVDSEPIRTISGAETIMCFEGCWQPDLGMVAMGYWLDGEYQGFDTKMFFRHDVTTREDAEEAIAKMRERVLREHYERVDAWS